MTPIDSAARATTAPRDERRPWLRLMGWSALVSSAIDVLVMAVVGEVVPPLVVGTVLTVLAIALLPRHPRFATSLLGVLSALIVASSLPFALPHLAHPESPIDFSHSVIHLGGRILTVIAAVGAWRSASQRNARLLTTAAMSAAAATIVVSVVASAMASDGSAEAGDVAVEVHDFEFPDTIRVASGTTLFVHNEDLVRHTFTVGGTALAGELPPRAGVRVGVELQPGTYEVHCDVPGHESMTAQLIVD